MTAPGVVPGENRGCGVTAVLVALGQPAASVEPPGKPGSFCPSKPGQAKAARLERLSVGVPVGLLRMDTLDRQNFAAPGAPGFEDFLSSFGSHPGPESMHPGAMATFRLVCSLWHYNLYAILKMDTKLYPHAL